MKFLLLFICGLVAGIINTLAGGGSFITVAAMIFMGLPPTVANGTNRIAILFQNIMAVKRFKHFDLVPTENLKGILIPAAMGAIAGAYMASAIPDATFKRIFGALMILISFITLYDPQRVAERLRPSPKLLPAIFFLIGIYGGFIQAGVGFFILAALSLYGMDLVRANAVKVLVILIFTVFALAIFAYRGKVDPLWGVVLAAGNATGAYIGVNLAVQKGHGFIRKFVLAALMVVAVRLIIG